MKTVTARMVQSDFPVDGIWIDGDHTDDYRWFRWNHTTYSNPIEMLNNISSYKKVAVSISDPHIKVDNTYPVYAEAKGKYFVRWSNGSDYVGKIKLITSIYLENNIVYTKSENFKLRIILSTKKCAMVHSLSNN